MAHNVTYCVSLSSGKSFILDSFVPSDPCVSYLSLLFQRGQKVEKETISIDPRGSELPLSPPALCVPAMLSPK